VRWRRKEPDAREPSSPPIIEGRYEVIVETQCGGNAVKAVAFVADDQREAQRHCRTIAYRTAAPATPMYDRHAPGNPFVVIKDEMRTIFYVRAPSEPSPFDKESRADLEQSAVEVGQIVARLNGICDRRRAAEHDINPSIDAAEALQQRLWALTELADDWWDEQDE
jgi:hypothetical protein